MKGCKNARCNTKYIKKFVFEYQEVFFTHREPDPWKDLKRLEFTVQWDRWKLKETFHDNVLYIFNPSTP